MLSNPPLNLLIAFPYFKPDVVEALRRTQRSTYRLIVDSGAFTAWNTGKDIRLDDYCRFLDSIAFLRPFHSVQLDVFGDPEASYKNFLIMKERGYDVMPVFTRGESLEKLESYYEQTDYIMFGGIVIGGKNRNYVKWFLNKNKGRKCHWLGFVNVPFIKAYKPESVDSSSWSGAARFGHMAFYDGFGSISTVSKKSFTVKPSSRIVEASSRIGISFSELKNLSADITWSRPWYFYGDDWSKPVPGMAQFISTLSHLLRGHEIEKKLGTKVFFAGAHNQINKTLFSAREYLIAKDLWK